MLTFRQLQARLQITRTRLIELVREGLPYETDGRRKQFDPAAVDAWLIAHGYATEAETEEPDAQIARTYAELAIALGMQSPSAVRIIAAWMKIPGFPGRPGRPGRRDAWLPVEEIRAWAAARGIRYAGDDGADDDDELRDTRQNRLLLALKVEEQDLLVKLGRMADVDEVARFNRQCVANARAVLEPLADEVLEMIGNQLPPEERAALHRTLTRLVDGKWNSLAAHTETGSEPPKVDLQGS